MSDTFRPKHDGLDEICEKAFQERVDICFIAEALHSEVDEDRGLYGQMNAARDERYADVIEYRTQQSTVTEASVRLPQEDEPEGPLPHPGIGERRRLNTNWSFDDAWESPLFTCVCLSVTAEMSSHSYYTIRK